MTKDAVKTVGTVGKVVMLDGLPMFKVFFSRYREEDNRINSVSILTPNMEVEDNHGFRSEEVEILIRYCENNIQMLTEMAMEKGFITFVMPLNTIKSTT